VVANIGGDAFTMGIAAALVAPVLLARLLRRHRPAVD
jgi:hypothetical protein